MYWTCVIVHYHLCTCLVKGSTSFTNTWDRLIVVFMIGDNKSACWGLCLGCKDTNGKSALLEAYGVSNWSFGSSAGYKGGLGVVSLSLVVPACSFAGSGSGSSRGAFGFPGCRGDVAKGFAAVEPPVAPGSMVVVNVVTDGRSWPLLTAVCTIFV